MKSDSGCLALRSEKLVIFCQELTQFIWQITQIIPFSWACKESMWEKVATYNPVSGKEPVAWGQTQTLIQGHPPALAGSSSQISLRFRLLICMMGRVVPTPQGRVEEMIQLEKALSAHSSATLNVIIIQWLFAQGSLWVSWKSTWFEGWYCGLSREQCTHLSFMWTGQGQWTPEVGIPLCEMDAIQCLQLIGFHEPQMSRTLWKQKRWSFLQPVRDC